LDGKESAVKGEDEKKRNSERGDKRQSRRQVLNTSDFSQEKTAHSEREGCKHGKKGVRKIQHL